MDYKFDYIKKCKSTKYDTGSNIFLNWQALSVNGRKPRVMQNDIGIFII